MTTELILKLVFFVVPLAYSAGPNNIMCAVIGSRYGLKKTIPFIAGINVNIFMYSMLIGFGLSRLINAFPWVQDVFRYGGAVFILYLAYGFFRSSAMNEEKNRKIPGFTEGFIVNSLNPKTITALVIIFAEFLPSTGNRLGNVFILSVFLVVLSMGSHFLWGLGGSTLTRYTRTEKGMKWIGYISGVMMVIVAVWIII